MLWVVPLCIFNAEVTMGMGVGVEEMGDLDGKRCTDEPTAWWTITPPKHAVSRNTLRAQKAIPAEMAIPVEMTLLGETMLEEGTRKHTTIAGSLAISDQIVFTTNEQRTHQTEFAKALLQSPLLEIKISFDYPIMCSVPPPPPPIQLGSWILGPLTICATIAAHWSHSRNYTNQCSLNLAMITQ
jgi:hypothetical protein